MKENYLEENRAFWIKLWWGMRILLPLLKCWISKELTPLWRQIQMLPHDRGSIPKSESHTWDFHYLWVFQITAFTSISQFLSIHSTTCTIYLHNIFPQIYFFRLRWCSQCSSLGLMHSSVLRSQADSQTLMIFKLLWEEKYYHPQEKQYTLVALKMLGASLPDSYLGFTFW